MTNKISNKIRYYRFINNEMTQKELADRVGVSRQTIIAIEKEKYSPSLELAFQIARTFNQPLETLFAYTPSQSDDDALPK